MRWPWQRRDEARAIKAEKATAKLRAVKRQTPALERLGDVMAELPPEELAERLRMAMVRRA